MSELQTEIVTNENTGVTKDSEGAKKTSGVKTITLPSGRIAEIETLKGIHIRKAQRLSDGASDMYMYAMISATTKIDGEGVIMEDLDEMDGQDVLALMGELGQSFS